VAADLGVDLYIADKKRDFDTGKILGIEMTEPLPKTGRYLVVDDICDGGGTFMGLANAIDLPKDQLGLWVTHGIFSGNAHLLRDHYRNIYTTDSHPGNNRVGVATMVVPTRSYMFQNLQKEFG
jgi:ribose-phosphate pyrophosphokinase